MVSERRSRKLLVVDDEPLVRQALAFVLQDEYDVVTVGSGEEALVASEKEAFPVVILDLCMEGLSGIETLRRLKEIRAAQNVIILTAYESMDTAISALNLGAFNYLTKPFERAHLKRVISQGFDLYEKQSARTEDMRQRLMGVHDTFFSLLCHEFNTPLNIILGFAELLKKERDDPDYLTWVEHIRESGEHLHDILMEIVDYTAASHLAYAGVEKPFVPRGLLQPLIREFQDKGVAILIEDEREADGSIIGPSEAVFMMVKKMLRMAAQRSKNVKVAVSIQRRDGPHLRIAVSGTRIFLSSTGGDEMRRLFEPYESPFRNGATGGAASLGLELATCRKIAEYAHSSVDAVFDRNDELELVASVPVRLAE